MIQVQVFYQVRPRKYNSPMRIAGQKQQIEATLHGTRQKIISEKNSLLSFSYMESDPNFPEALPSIGTNLSTGFNIEWKNIEDLCASPNYSSDIVDLEATQYCNRAITECLLILNWFAASKFQQIFKERAVSKMRTYTFVLSIGGIPHRISINSKVPLRDGQVIFAESVGNSIFPALFEKATAKAYECYQAIPDDVCQLLQLWTGYVPQLLSTNQYKAPQFVSVFQDCLHNNDLIFFRTRNSTRLEQSGDFSNKKFIITRVLPMDSTHVVEFIEFSGAEWTGRFCKSHSFWANKSAEVEKYKINLGPGRENYMQIGDLLSISREIQILHNTRSLNKNWRRLQGSKPESSSAVSLRTNDASRVLVGVHFDGRSARSCAYIILAQKQELRSYSFHRDKGFNFLAAALDPGSEYILIVEAEDNQGQPLGSNITVYSSNCFCEIQTTSISKHLQEKTFLNFLHPLPTVFTELDPHDKRNAIKVKNMAKQFGMGMLVVDLQQNFGQRIQIKFNVLKMKETGIELMNSQQQKVVLEGPYHKLFLFKIKGNHKKGTKFPPQGSVEIAYV